MTVKVKKEGCQQFEETWKNRESHLKDTPGFIRFALLRGDEEGGQSLSVLRLVFYFSSPVCQIYIIRLVAGDYISQTTWGSRKDFQNWTQSNNVCPWLRLSCISC